MNGKEVICSRGCQCYIQRDKRATTQFNASICKSRWLNAYGHKPTASYIFCSTDKI